MIKNYFLIAFRSIFKNKLFSFVNILGLAFGITSSLLIFLWVNDELNVDQFHEKKERLYRVMENQQYSDGRLFTFASTPGPMAPFIKEKYPEIEKASRYTWQVNNLFQYNEKAFYEEGRYAETDFLQMFSFNILSGDAETALKDKSGIVITKKMAEKYFGDEDPIGKTLLMNTKDVFTVSAVMADLPKSSSFQFSYLLPFQSFWDENKSWLDQWDNNNIRTFILLKDKTNMADFAAKFKHEVREHVEKTNVELFIQPVADAYLYGEFENGKQAGGRIEYVRIFFVIAVFILTIACINFMNLATAQSSKRAKEVGLRKVIGAVPRQLFYQFMGESFLTVLISSLIALVLVIILLPIFSEITGKQLGFNLLDKSTLFICIAVLVFTSLLAGSYPSLFISAFKPVEVIKGQLKSGNSASLFRKVLVVVQFSLSIILIISTIVVSRQMDFMQNRDIGFVRENVFYAWMEGEVGAKFEMFRQRALALPGVESITASSQLPIDLGNSTSGVNWEGKNPDDRILFTNVSVDYDFVQTMKMKMAEGRSFDRNLSTDSLNYIVNQKAAEKIGFTNGTAGQELTMWDKKGKIVGVVEDFNFGSLHNPIDPLIMRISSESDWKWGGCVLVRAKENATADAIASIENLWKELAPGYPFRYAFLDQDWQEFYKAEDQRGKVFNVLSALSIFISCLGLFGLSSFSAERRTKELGVRKVLGASVQGLVQLMSKEFTLLVLIAAAISCPIGWYLMSEWLSTYAYHVNVGIMTLGVATVLCLLISLLTVAYHSIRVSMANPAKSLRYE